jgi:thiamine biosynthesis lipoprotein
MKWFHNPLLVLITILILFVSCNDQKVYLHKFNGEAQGTYYAVTYFDKENRNLQTEIKNLLNDFDQTASMWVPNSIISAINRNEMGIEPDEIFIQLFNQSKEIHQISGGAFDPTVGPLVNAWGFGFKDKEKINQELIDSLLPLIGFEKVKLKENKIIKEDPRIQFDFNAIAQGYSVDLIGKFLEDKGINQYLIDVGGEVLAKGSKPNGDRWKVGIEKPKDNAAYGESLQAIVLLENKALATSGNYRKFYEEDGVRYSHTLNPKTGYPVQHTLLSVSVVADACSTADAFATTFMVLGVEESKQLLANNPGLEAYFIFSEKDEQLGTYITKGFEKILQESGNQ